MRSTCSPAGCLRCYDGMLNRTLALTHTHSKKGWTLEISGYFSTFYSFHSNWFIVRYFEWTFTVSASLFTPIECARFSSNSDDDIDVVVVDKNNTDDDDHSDIDTLSDIVRGGGGDGGDDDDNPIMIMQTHIQVYLMMIILYAQQQYALSLHLYTKREHTLTHMVKWNGQICTATATHWMWIETNGSPSLALLTCTPLTLSPKKKNKCINKYWPADFSHAFTANGWTKLITYVPYSTASTCVYSLRYQCKNALFSPSIRSRQVRTRRTQASVSVSMCVE